MKTGQTILLAGLLSCGLCIDAQAASFSGKFDIVQASGSGTSTSVRYYSVASALSIYVANDAFGPLLQSAFFRKASVDIAYTPAACPAGISGTCGNLIFISVAASAIP